MKNVFVKMFVTLLQPTPEFFYKTAGIILQAIPMFSFNDHS